ncbi:hypothetical protein FRC01_003202 [Tulasnella sp. 417]|nr:hypothetical protein FRC01_003202 [Tulasnella sp. 417]
MDSLPEELFIQIILRVIGTRDQVKGRSRLLEVSPAWKRAIEGCYMFWTEAIVHGGPEPLQEVLSHNPLGPLDVRLRITLPKVADEETLAQLAFVSEHSSRWRSLSIEGLLTDNVIAHFKNPTPKLKSICIIAYLGAFNPTRSLEFDQMGNFSRLHLTSIDMDWNSPRLCGLRVLRLHFLNREQTPSLEQLAACLRASPELRVLVLKDLTGSEASPVAEPKEIAFQFLSLTTIYVCSIPADILEFIILSLKAPNCNLLSFSSLNVSMARLTDMILHLKSLLHRHIFFRNTFTLRYIEISSSISFLDSDRLLPPSHLIQDWDPGEGPGISVGFRPAPNLYPGEELHRFLNDCYPLLCDVLADLLVPQDAFQVTLLLDHQQREGYHVNDLTGLHPSTFPLHLLNHLPFITRIATNRWFNWSAILDYLSKPQKNPATGEESWPCPNLQVVEFEKEPEYIPPSEMEEMHRVLDGFVEARSATTALQSVKFPNEGADCVRIWDRGQGWSVVSEMVAPGSL